LPKLEYLDASENRIEKFENFEGHEKIKVLKLCENKLKLIPPFNLPAIEEYNLTKNPIPSFKDFPAMPTLKRFFLRGTKIDKVEEELPELEAIELLSFRDTKISNLDNLKNVFNYATLTNLNILGTPLYENASSENYLTSEIMIIYPKIQVFSKQEITD